MTSSKFSHMNLIDIAMILFFITGKLTMQVISVAMATTVISLWVQSVEDQLTKYLMLAVMDLII